MHGILSFGTWLNMFFFGLYIIYLPVLQKINSCTLRSSKTNFNCLLFKTPQKGFYWLKWVIIANENKYNFFNCLDTIELDHLQQFMIVCLTYFLGLKMFRDFETNITLIIWLRIPVRFTFNSTSFFIAVCSGKSTISSNKMQYKPCIYVL